MRRMLTAIAFASLPLVSTITTPASAQQEGERQLGSVHFATSCNDTAQRRFDRAMRYQHSFWYKQSAEIFAEALAADPKCAIALYGVALSLLNNPHGQPPAPNLATGLEAITKAREIGAQNGAQNGTVTQRERDTSTPWRSCTSTTTRSRTASACRNSSAR